MHYTDFADFIHLRSSAVSAGVICQKNPVRDITEINNVGARHHLPSSMNPVRDWSSVETYCPRWQHIPLGMFQHETMPLLCVLCAWLIPNGMNARGCLAFSTELYCLRQIIPQRPPVIFGLFLSWCIAYGKSFRNEPSLFSDYSCHAVLPSAKSYRNEPPLFSDYSCHAVLPTANHSATHYHKHFLRS